jgi:hypothetical protein
VCSLFSLLSLLSPLSLLSLLFPLSPPHPLLCARFIRLRCQLPFSRASAAPKF